MDALPERSQFRIRPVPAPERDQDGGCADRALRAEMACHEHFTWPLFTAPLKPNLTAISGRSMNQVLSAFFRM